jgi:hypothetical protein
MTEVKEIEKVAEEAKVEQPRIGQVTLGPSCLQIADHLRSRWAAVVEERCTAEDLLRPAFWQHVSAKMHMFDAIEVIPETRAWFAELRVIDTGNGFAKVILVNHIVVDDDLSISSNMDYTTEVAWKGPQKKYCVIRLSDGVILKEGFERKEGAKRAQLDLEMVFSR